MSAGRVCVLLTAFAGIALLLVHLRAEQTRCAARTLVIECKRIELWRELWRVQAGVARLQAPPRVHERAARLWTELIPPSVDEQSVARIRFASAGRYE